MVIGIWMHNIQQQHQTRRAVMHTINCIEMNWIAFSATRASSVASVKQFLLSFEYIWCDWNQVHSTKVTAPWSVCFVSAVVGSGHTCIHCIAEWPSWCVDGSVGRRRQSECMPRRWCYSDMDCRTNGSWSYRTDSSKERGTRWCRSLCKSTIKCICLGEN